MATQPVVAPARLSAARAPLLVLGLGNVLLRDEGVGVRVVEAMRALPLPPEIELCDGGTASLTLLDVLDGRRKIVVVDALEVGTTPGSVVRLTGEDFLGRSAVRVSLHELGFAETLLAAQRMGLAPAEVVILGVQPQTIACGLDLSPPLVARIPHLVDRVLLELGLDPRLRQRMLAVLYGRLAAAARSAGAARVGMGG